MTNYRHPVVNQTVTGVPVAFTVQLDGNPMERFPPMTKNILFLYFSLLTYSFSALTGNFLFDVVSFPGSLIHADGAFAMKKKPWGTFITAVPAAGELSRTVLTPAVHAGRNVGRTGTFPLFPRA